MTNCLVHVAGQGDAHLTGNAPSMSHGFTVACSAGVGNVSDRGLGLGASVSVSCVVAGSSVLIVGKDLGSGVLSINVHEYVCTHV